MSREWKSGDVAVISVPRSSAPGEPLDAVGHVEIPAVNDGDGWVALGHFDYCWPDDYDYFGKPARPLVVIDPEDREQVERLATHLGQDHWYGTTGYLQAALREFANPTPPRPPEPTGLGAVVEDAEGGTWVRNHPPTCPDGAACIPWRVVWPDSRTANYRDITAVRVLSEGVTT